LLVRRDSFLVLNLGLDVINGITRLNIESDSFSGESFYENLESEKKKEKDKDD